MARSPVLTEEQPDETTTLVDDIASTIAHVFNTCGFDMIYMDGVTANYLAENIHEAVETNS